VIKSVIGLFWVNCHEDYKLTYTNVILPVEFAHNRLLVVSSKIEFIKLMSNCANGITEYPFETDAVVMIPSNCSYISNTMQIMARESDTQITKEVGLPEIQRLEIDTVQNAQWKLANTEIADISGNLSRHGIEMARKEIQAELDKIDTKHDSVWEGYKVERWGLLGGLGTVVCGTIIFKLACRVRISRKKDRKSNDEEIELRDMTKHQRQLKQQQQQQQQQLNDANDEEVYTETRSPPQTQTQRQTKRNDMSKSEHVYVELDGASSVSFSLPPEKSQFFKK